MSEGAAPSGQSQAQQMSVVSGLMLLGLIVVAIGVFYFIGLKFIALPMEVFFAAFTLLWHWATVEAAEFSRLPNSVIGALVGVALAWQSTYLGGRYGMPNGLLMGLIPIVIALFLVIMNWVPIAFNSSAMLFVTILGAPALAKQGEFLQLAEAVIVGAVFFAAVVWAAKQYVEMRNKAKSGAVAA
jgi:hypothetical protein